MSEPNIEKVVKNIHRKTPQVGRKIWRYINSCPKFLSVYSDHRPERYCAQLAWSLE